VNLLKIRTRGDAIPSSPFPIRFRDDFALNRRLPDVSAIKTNVTPDEKSDRRQDSETLRPPVGV